MCAPTPVYVTSTGTLHRASGLPARPFSITPPCRHAAALRLRRGSGKVRSEALPNRRADIGQMFIFVTTITLNPGKTSPKSRISLVTFDLFKFHSTIKL